MKKDDHFEHELHRQLKQATDKAVFLKEDTWKNIEQQLFTDRKGKSIWKKRVGISIGMVAAAAMLLVMIFSSGLFTSDMAEEPDGPDVSKGDLGHDDPVKGNPEGRLADQYEQEKQMEVAPEGMKEMVDMQLAVNEDLRYVIYYDKDNYEFILRETNDEDLLQSIGVRDDRYPPVGMYIMKQTNTTLEEQIDFVKEDIEEDGMSITGENETNEPFDAYVITAHEGEEQQWDWDTRVHRYYITDVGNGTLFLFKQTFYIEALDGAPLRLDLMLSTFEYVGEEPNEDD